MLQIILVLALLALSCRWLLRQLHRGRLTQATSQTEAGLEQWPRVRGRLPGNIDILHGIGRNAQNRLPGEALANLAYKYGHTFELRILGSSMLYTQDPEVIRHIMSKNNDNYVKGQFLNDLFRDVLGTGIFNSDGPEWKLHRAAARPFFVKENLRDFGVYTKHAEHLVNAIKTLSQDGSGIGDPQIPKAIEFHNLASRYTLDSASDFTFGKSINSLGAAALHQADPPYMAAFTRVQDRLANRLALVFERRGKIVADMQVVSAMVDDAIRTASEPEKCDAPIRTHTFLALLNNTPLLYDTVKRRDELLNVLMAARDTTASLISSIMYELARNTTIQQELREEIYRSIGEDSPLTFEDVKQLPLLRAVINESLRMYPPIAANSRVAVEDDIIDVAGRKYVVQAGTHVAWGIFQLQRRTDIWGEDANQWKPSRWLSSEKQTSNKQAAFQAWGFGPRICIGQELAYLEISCLLCHLLQKFRIIEFAKELQPSDSWVPGTEDLDVMPEAPVVTLTLRGGVWLRFTPR